jgi:hypothetical protein
MGAFRTADGSEVLEAQTHEGTLRLEVAPRHVALALGGIQVAITAEFVTFTEKVRNKVKRWSEGLSDTSGGLIVARDVPHEDLGLWLDLGLAGVRRIFGVAPHDLITDDGLTALRALDRLGHRLRQVLAPFGHGALRGFELGRGLDKVLIADHGEHLVVYARRLFAGTARRVVEVRSDGTVLIPHRHGNHSFQIRDRWGITVTGDLVRFMDSEGADLGQVVLHWTSSEDRLELARRFGLMIERHHAPRPELERSPTSRRASARARSLLNGRITSVRQLRTGWRW